MMPAIRHPSGSAGNTGRGQARTHAEAVAGVRCHESSDGAGQHKQAISCWTQSSASSCNSPAYHKHNPNSSICCWSCHMPYALLAQIAIAQVGTSAWISALASSQAARAVAGFTASSQLRCTHSRRAISRCTAHRRLSHSVLRFAPLPYLGQSLSHARCFSAPTKPLRPPPCARSSGEADGLEATAEQQQQVQPMTAATTTQGLRHGVKGRQRCAVPS